MTPRTRLASSGRCWSNTCRHLWTTTRAASSSGGGPLLFSCHLPSGELTAQHMKEFASRITEQGILTNPDRHNAAVILATSGMATQLLDRSFIAGFARLMMYDAHVPDFHVLAAIVDHVAPQLDNPRPIQGISVLRGHLDEILPDLWQPSPQIRKEDADTVAALTFDTRKRSFTLPLSRTTFSNHQTSTLIANQCQMNDKTSTLVKRIGKLSQHINLSSVFRQSEPPPVRVRAKLVPLTQARVVTSGFGNIIKSIDLDGQPAPASTELETSMDSLVNMTGLTGARNRDFPIWGLITPDPTSIGFRLQDAPRPLKFEEIKYGEPVDTPVQHITNMLDRGGGRLYRILSGGGGWGFKKGLLSLDPQRRHFALSEEEELESFMQDTANFAPPGSIIQFFTGFNGVSPMSTTLKSNIIFGVAGPFPEDFSPESPPEDFSIEHHFGALSDTAIYLSDPQSAEHSSFKISNSVDESKLSVFHSRITVGEESTRGGGVEPLAFVLGAVPLELF